MAENDERLDRREVVAHALRCHRARLRAFVHARVSSDDADDVVQIAAMRAVERAHTLRDPGRVLPWLFRLHRHVIIDWARKRSAEQRWVDEDASVFDAATASPTERCRCSVTQVQHLSPSYSAILSLVDLGESSLSEAAEQLGVSVNNATVRLHRARKALRERMREHCGVTRARDCNDCRCAYEGCCAA
ncbi:MAG: RNA polymerase sigma factor [Myxococcota bacterium]